MRLSTRQSVYLQAMGIDIWREQGFQMEQALPALTENRDSSSTQTDDSPEWLSLRLTVAACTQCELHKSRKQTVFGVGDNHADWMIIGEAPGAEEDRQGEPFVGRAGQLLNNMLKAVGLERDKVFIANILKCRPPNNRDPEPEEVTCCESYLQKQIEMIQPKVILALGRVAAQNLLKVDTPIGRMRGNQYQHPKLKTPVIVTYHPAYLLRSPREKRKSWQDLLLAKRIYEQTS